MTGTNLLTDPIFELELDGQPVRRNLPGVLAGLATAGRASFPRLRAHQTHGWHMFLVQLARIALDRAGCPGLPADTAAWTRLLTALTPDQPGAWDLVADDHRAPAFLQAPLPSGNVDGWTRKPTPDGIDLTFAARAHVLKVDQDWDARPEDWVYALVTSQTLAPYSSPGQHRVVRMSDNMANRTMITLCAADCPARMFRRDVAAIADLPVPQIFRRTGPGLLWLEPWGGTSDEVRGLQGLHPQFIEVARLVRLVRDGRGLAALRGKAAAPRFLAAGKKSQVKGVLGDPWTPVDRQRSAAFHAPKAGLDTPTTLHLLLDPQRFQPAPLQRLHAGEHAQQDLLVIARTLLSSERGKLGYDERVIALPRPARRILGQTPAPRQGEIVQNLLTELNEVRRTAVRPAAASLFQPTRDTIDWDAIEANPVEARIVARTVDTVDRLIEPVVLGRLEQLLSEPEGAGPGHSALRRSLVKAARMSLDRAAAVHACAGYHGQMARSIAQGRLDDRLWRLLGRREAVPA